MERYVLSINDTIATEGILSDQDIIGFVVSKTAEDESDEDKAPPPPLVTVKEVHSTMQTVLRFEEQANSESNIRSEELHFLRKLHKQYQREYEKLKKQTSIREFLIMKIKKQ